MLGEDGSGGVDAILAGLEHVMYQFNAKTSNGVKPKMVVNMSLGSAQTIPSMDEAVKEMADKGVIIVVAAGILHLSHSMQQVYYTFPIASSSYITPFQ